MEAREIRIYLWPTGLIDVVNGFFLTVNRVTRVGNKPILIKFDCIKTNNG